MKKLLFTLLITSTSLYAQADLIFKNGMEFVARLNDTGITWAGEFPSGNNVDCTSTTITSPQDCNQGRDFTHNDDTDGHAGFSFTKLDANGIPLVDQSVDYASTPWACVQDNVTGLVWEVKTAGGGIHNKNNTYKWGGITHQGDNFGTYFNEWDSLVNVSNSDNFCGFSDWRVPSKKELTSILDYSGNQPTIEISFFPNTVGSVYWTSSPDASNSGTAWHVDFSYAYSDGYYYDRFFGLRLRLVH